MNTLRKTHVSPLYFASLLIAIAGLAWSVESYDQNIVSGLLTTPLRG
jgi:hypothetical protein